MTKVVELGERSAGPPGASDDYQTIRRAIRFLRTEAEAAEPPSLNELADHLGLSASHCQRIFKRWCGLSPKDFTAAIALDRARTLLAESASVLETAHAVGMSGGSRLHDLFVTHEAMTPGAYKNRGAGLCMAWGRHRTPFGDAVAISTDRGLAGLAFVDDDKGQTPKDAFQDLARRWPGAEFREDATHSQGYMDVIFEPSRWSARDPVRLVLIGTDFEVRVWEALLRIPMGHAVSYRDVASKVCSAKASRAVGAAVGKNPLSFVVPCHRVLRADGGLGGYHWGVTRKLALIGWEAGQVAEGR